MGLDEAYKVLTSATPLGVIGLLSWIVYLLVSKRGPVNRIANNHLHDLPEMKKMLGDIRDGINILVDRTK